MNLDWLRNEVIGGNTCIKTPYGDRLMTYADYTASGRNLKFVEDYMRKIGETYANTHTEDCFLGMQTTKLYHEARERIKELLKADDHYVVLSVGNGTTGAIQRLAQIIGIYEAPATRIKYDKDSKYYNPNRPIIFVGPYEHHSNELIWKEGNAEVVEIGLTDGGKFSTADLENQISDPKYKDRIKIGAFSAASNVTGMKSPVKDITRIMHQYGGLVFFDFAASGPYVNIELVQRDGCYYDAVYLSPHKFIGGPGSNGLLLFRKDIYNQEVGPTCAGGGTVEYVSSHSYDFIKDIESREDAGTPGIFQTLRAAATLEVKNAVGIDRIEELESIYISRSIQRLTKDSKIEMIGPKDMENRLGILSFNVKYKDGYLHPRFVTTLLNDLFGIQSRAGCSCAGPYGHLLLGIIPEKSEQYRKLIKEGCEAIKPGWVRLNFHYLLDDITYDFIINAIEFIADYGYLFLQDYSVECETGNWSHNEKAQLAGKYLDSFDLDSMLKAKDYKVKSYNKEKAKKSYETYMKIAYRLKEMHEVTDTTYSLYRKDEFGDLAWFYVKK